MIIFLFLPFFSLMNPVQFGITDFLSRSIPQLSMTIIFYTFTNLNPAYLFESQVFYPFLSTINPYHFLSFYYAR